MSTDAPPGTAPGIGTRSTMYQPYFTQVSKSLPPGWAEYADQTGRKYYYNLHTRMSTYEIPTTAAPLTMATPWVEYKDKGTGRAYYYNTVSKACVWEEPEELRVQKAREEAMKLGVLAERGGTDDALRRYVCIWLFAFGFSKKNRMYDAILICITSCNCSILHMYMYIYIYIYI